MTNKQALPVTEEKFILDKNSKKIEIGDVLKVFHFVGARRKKFYMYKQVVGMQPFGNDQFYKVNHLSSLDGCNYSLILNNERLPDVEIVDNIGSSQDFEYRPKIDLIKF